MKSFQQGVRGRPQVTSFFRAGGVQSKSDLKVMVVALFSKSKVINLFLTWLSTSLRGRTNFKGRTIHGVTFEGEGVSLLSQR